MRVTHRICPGRLGVGSDGITRPAPRRDLDSEEYVEIVGPRETGEWEPRRTTVDVCEHGRYAIDCGLC